MPASDLEKQTSGIYVFQYMYIIGIAFTIIETCNVQKVLSKYDS